MINFFKNTGYFMRLFSKSWYKSFQGPFFAFVFPLILSLIIGALITANNSPALNSMLFTIPTSVGTLTSMSLGLMSLPDNLLTFKESSLVKRIKTSPISPLSFFAGSVFFYMIIGTLSFVWGVAWYLMIFHKEFLASGVHITVGSVFSFIFAFYLTFTLILSFGLLVASISKSKGMAMGISMLIYFPSMFLVGAAIPYSLIASSDALRIVSYFLPVRYGAELIMHCWLGQSLFGSTNMAVKMAFDNHILPDYALILITLGLTSLCFFGVYKTWSWEG